MCTTCGCGKDDIKIDGEQRAGDNHSHAEHRHDHQHSNETRLIEVEQDLLAKNNRYAAENRRRFSSQGVFVVNLVSSPGSGKTTLLVRTVSALVGQAPIAVIEGDQQTSRDVERIRSAGVPGVQINTGKGCHLDAHMIGHALEQLVLPEGGVLFIENVGNLVCPAAFDLGEAHKVVIISVTEGEDKPLKYPDMFAAADMMIVNKVDLLPYVEFHTKRCVEYAKRVNPEIEVLILSATSGAGLDDWYAWVSAGRDACLAARDFGETTTQHLPGPVHP